MGADWIYHNIWQCFSLINLKSIKLNTEHPVDYLGWQWGLYPYLWSHNADFFSCTLCSRYLQFDAKYRGEKSNMKQKRQFSFTVNFGYCLDGCWEITLTKMFKLVANWAWRQINLDQYLQQIKALSFVFSQCISNCHDAVLGVTLLFMKHKVYTQGTQLPTRSKIYPS